MIGPNFCVTVNTIKVKKSNLSRPGIWVSRERSTKIHKISIHVGKTHVVFTQIPPPK